VRSAWSYSCGLPAMEEPDRFPLGVSQRNAIDGFKLDVAMIQTGVAAVAFCDDKQNVHCLNGAVIVELSSVWVGKVE
jgi:hypothetical protein